MVDHLGDFLVLESSILVNYGNGREGLATYMGRSLSCLSFPSIFCRYSYCLSSVLGEMAPKMTVEEVRHRALRRGVLSQALG